MKENFFTPKAKKVYDSHKLLIRDKVIQCIHYETSKKPLFKVKRIITASHPACGQSGLFAASKIPPKTLILNYCGLVHTDSESNPNSDYDIRFVNIPEVNEILSIDAEKVGNEARFINDYRGIIDRPNVCFENYIDRRGEVQIGVFSLNSSIDKGEELCVTYGKGFWNARK